jgi:hypothetical protein
LLYSITGIHLFEPDPGCCGSAWKKTKPDATESLDN